MAPSVAPQSDLSGLNRAYVVMESGCRFLIARGRHKALTGHHDHGHPLVRWRMAGNSLKELDRFLSILLQECAVLSGRKLKKGGIGEDTAAGLHWIDASGHHFSTDMTRLRAIERIRKAACGEQMIGSGVRLERDFAVATAGLPAAGRARVRPPEISDQAIAAIAEFYLALADRLHARFAEGIV